MPRPGTFGWGWGAAGNSAQQSDGASCGDRRDGRRDRRARFASRARHQTGQPASIIVRTCCAATPEVQMATAGRDMETVELTDETLWRKGPPHEVFKEMRAKCPVHWTEQLRRVPRGGGLLVDHDAPRTSTRSAATGRPTPRNSAACVAAAGGFPIELARAMFIGMDPPKHDRLKALFQSRLHAEADRRSRGCDPRDHDQRARPARGPRGVRPRQRRRAADRRARDRQLHGHPRGGRRDLGAADERRRSPPATDINPDGVEGVVEKDIPEIFERCRQADRRAPGEPDRRPHERARATPRSTARSSRSTRS